MLILLEKLYIMHKIFSGAAPPSKKVLDRSLDLVHFHVELGGVWVGFPWVLIGVYQKTAGLIDIVFLSSAVRLET